MLAPIPFNDDSRVNALRSLDFNYFDSDERLDRITELAAQEFSTPFSFLTIIEKDKAIFTSTHGSDAKELPREHGICSHVITEINKRAPMLRGYEIRDTLLDDRFASNDLVQNNPKIRSYLSHTLQTRDGYNMGTLCVMDVVPRNFSAEEKYRLAVLGQVANKILIGKI